MKRLILHALCAQVLVLCVSITPLNAQSLWNWKYPMPQGNALNDLDIMLPNTAIAVGILGSVVKTSDRGATWGVCPTIPGLTELGGVSFLGATTVVAVGNGGVILRSVDLGQTWNAQASGTTSRLWGVDFLDTSHGIAVGAGGSILRSNDGGTAWEMQASGTLSPLYAVTMVDANTATVVGAGGTILRTVDGGANWVPRISGTIVNLFDVDFIDANTGMAVGYGPTVLITIDGGDTWLPPSTPLPAFPPAELRAVDVIDATNAVAVGVYDTDGWMGPQETGLLVRSSNGGDSWSQITEPSHLFGVAMFTSSEGAAVGGAGSIRRTTNGGASWPQVAGGIQRFEMQGVDFYDAQRGVAVSFDNVLVQNARSSRVYRTGDGGAAWTVDQPFPWCDAFDVAFADMNTVYVVGNGPWIMDVGGKIWRSTDGGINWVDFFGTCCYPCAERCIGSLSAVDFAGPNAGVAVGDETDIADPSPVGAVVTILGGVATWLPSPTTVPLNGVSVPTPQTAYAVGDDGVILKGDLVGGSWVELTSGTSQPLFDVFFTDDMTGTAVGGMGTVLRTLDGGDSWEPQTSGTTGTLTSVSFIDANNGLIGTAGATLLKTHNGGVTWLPEETPSMLADVDFIDLVTAVAIGGDENIVTRLDTPVPVIGSLPPALVTLLQNTPNPFNPATRIRFTLPARMRVTLSVFDIAGRRITTLIDGVRPGGEHEVTWDGKNSAGDPAPSGIYFYQLKTPSGIVARKMVLLK